AQVVLVDGQLPPSGGHPSAGAGCGRHGHHLLRGQYACGPVVPTVGAPRCRCPRSGPHWEDPTRGGSMSGDLEHQRSEAREELSTQGAGMGLDDEPTTFEPEEDPEAVEDDDPSRVLPDEERPVGDAESEEERL